MLQVICMLTDPFFLLIIVFKSSGGVVLASQDGKIVFENTLDARLDVVFRQKLPEVRTNSAKALSFIATGCNFSAYFHMESLYKNCKFEN